jgi:hypothetical protein
MTGVEHSLFLDVLFPDYNYTSRLCTHYKEVPSAEPSSSVVRLEVDEEPEYEMIEF